MSRQNVAVMAIRMQSLEREIRWLKNKLSDQSVEIMRLQRVEADYKRLSLAYAELVKDVKLEEFDE